MKKILHQLASLAVLALLFSSCTGDGGLGSSKGENAVLSFGVIVADLSSRTNNKQSDIEDLPDCIDEGEPAYVEIVLMQDEEIILGELEPYRVDLVTGQVFTEDDPALELTPGTYSLEHFSVYDSAGNLMSIAPKGGVLSRFVDVPLPLTIELGAGVKKYVDVSVICYDNRQVNQYGYEFFEFHTSRVLTFCFFANYCLGDQVHFPARFSVEFSIDGDVIYEGEENINEVGENSYGDYFASPICFALPDLSEYEDDEEYLDYTVTLLDWQGIYQAPEDQIITGSLSRNEIISNFDGDDRVFYEHLRFGCELE